MVTALLVEDNEADVNLMRQAVADAGAAQIELTHAARLREALTCLARDRFDVILLDLSLPDSKGLSTVVRMREAAPTTPILVLTGLNDDAVAVRALESGAQDYLVKGVFDGVSLARAVRYAVARQQAQATASQTPSVPRRDKLVGFLGVKGGCGVTSVACHTAAELRLLTGQRVLLADFDLVSGAADFLARSTCSFSVLDAAENAERLDLELWKGLVSSGLENMDVLGAPAGFSGQKLPRPGRFAEVLSFARPHYDWIVTDLGRGLTEISTSLLHDTDRAFLVTTPDVLALSRARQIVETLSDSGYPQDRLGLVINRVSKRPRLTTEQIAGILKLPVYAAFPDCGEEVCSSYLQGTLVPRNGTLGRQFTRLASKLAGIEPAAKRRWFSISPTRSSQAGASAGDGGLD